MEIYLIRHTTPEVAKGMIYGRTDVALTADRDEKIKQISGKLPSPLDAVYSSPSGRCTYLADQISANYIIDERLYEVNFGLWEGKTWDTVDQQELNLWMQDFVNACPPEGESMIRMNQRVMDFWHQLLQQPYQRVAIVTHGGVIRLILSAITQTPLQSAFEIQINYGDVFLLSQQQNTSLRYMARCLF
jgi:alpha-ribazole phosphatase